MNSNVKWWAGMVACVLIALAGQADAMPEPWNHVFSIGGVIGTAVSGYMIRPQA
jgi:high-affinity nickel permease